MAVQVRVTAEAEVPFEAVKPVGRWLRVPCCRTRSSNHDPLPLRDLTGPPVYPPSASRMGRPWALAWICMALGSVNEAKEIRITPVEAV